LKLVDCDDGLLEIALHLAQACYSNIEVGIGDKILGLNLVRKEGEAYPYSGVLREFLDQSIDRTTPPTLTAVAPGPIETAEVLLPNDIKLSGVRVPCEDGLGGPYADHSFSGTSGFSLLAARGKTG